MPATTDVAVRVIAHSSNERFCNGVPCVYCIQEVRISFVRSFSELIRVKTFQSSMSAFELCIAFFRVFAYFAEENFSRFRKCRSPYSWL